MYFSYWGGKLTGMNDIHIPAFTIRKEIVVGIIFFVAGALLFSAFSTIATTIGTNVSVTGHLFATSTVQATGNIVGYADLILGTTTPWKGADYVFEQQAGTQPVFLVGDTGTSTPHFVITPKGYVGIGTAAPSAQLEILGTDPNVIISRYINTTGGPTFRIRKARGSEAVPLTVANGDAQGAYDFYAHDGTSFLNTARIRAIINGTVATNIIPTDLQFFTKGDSDSASEKVRITGLGNVGIGTTSPASLLSLSSSGTTTIHVGTTATTKGSCFQMYDAAHVAYRAFISKAGTWTVEAGTCE